MDNLRVLLVAKEDRLPAELPSLLERESNRALVAESTTAVQDALAKISEKGYDAVVCWAERQEELAAVIQIRKASPITPILLLTSQEATDFQELARLAGATHLARTDQELAVIAEHIRLSIQSGELLRQHRALMERCSNRSSGMQPFAQGAMESSTSVRAKVSKAPDTLFMPLLVEDDPDQAALMILAFEKAVFAPLPVLTTGEEAIAYLSSAPPFENRDRFPLPSVLILDIHLPKKSGLDVLEWMRAQPQLKQLPVVMLSRSTDPNVINRAYQLGANSYLIKPTSFTALVELVSGLERYSGTLNERPGPPVR
ncbi:MAG TPA: response regulator [Planctomycetota bacterium]|nr:response regulator [Planctomycetota bacterium]